MSIITCKECGNIYSDLLSSDCPYCKPNTSVESEQQKAESSVELPENLEIGRALPFWDFDAMCFGRFSNDYLTGTDYESYGFSSKKSITLSLHTHGIAIIQGLTSYRINNAQISSMHFAKECEQSISLDNAHEPVDLMIYYIDSETLKDRLIVVRCNRRDQAMAFLNRRDYEMMTNEILEREPEHSYISLWIKLLLTLCFIIALYLFCTMILKI